MQTHQYICRRDFPPQFCRRRRGRTKAGERRERGTKWRPALNGAWGGVSGWWALRQLSETWASIMYLAKQRRHGLECISLFIVSVYFGPTNHLIYIRPVDAVNRRTSVVIESNSDPALRLLRGRVTPSACDLSAADRRKLLQMITCNFITKAPNVDCQTKRLWYIASFFQLLHIDRGISRKGLVKGV